MKRVAIDLCSCPEHGGLEPDGSHLKGCSWYDTARSAMLVEVTDCASCPFAISEESPWYCDALGFEANPRELPDQTVAGDAPWPPPPDWCPLRRADHLVTLRVK